MLLVALVAACTQPTLTPEKKLGSIRGVEYGLAEAITLASAVSTFTTPSTANTGTDVASWATNHNRAAPTSVAISFTASGATVVAGPIAIWETRSDGTVLMAGLLNDGADIIIPGANAGTEYAVNLGTASKLQVAPAPTSTNLTGSTSTATNAATVTVKATPIYEVLQ